MDKRDNISKASASVTLTTTELTGNHGNQAVYLGLAVSSTSVATGTSAVSRASAATEGSVETSGTTSDELVALAPAVDTSETAGCCAPFPPKTPAPTANVEDRRAARGRWKNPYEATLSCLGLSVGLSNFLTFPYLAHKHGGGSFIIAYIILQLFIGSPMYVMELALGQFSGKGPTKVWEINPGASGLGLCMCRMSLVVTIYYNVLMAYSLHFFFGTWQKTLPWTECISEWSDEFQCVPKNPPATDNSAPCFFSDGNCTTAGDLFYQQAVTVGSEGFELGESLGTPIPELALCLLAVWIVVVSCLAQGVNTSGKVAYFTSTFPYLLLVLLVVRGVNLDGALAGVEVFFTPDWEEFTSPHMWLAAASQMFFSLSLSLGGLVMTGSYNKFKFPLYGQAVVASTMDCGTSIMAGLLVFSSLGNLAQTLKVSVDEVAQSQSGYHLIFVNYVEEISTASHVWPMIFFLMLFLFGLDSVLGLMNTMLTCIQDKCPKRRRHKCFQAFLLGTLCYIIALACICPGGVYVMTLLETYGVELAVPVVACLEMVSVIYVYGGRRLMADIEYMMGPMECKSARGFLLACWYTAPLALLTLLIVRCVNYSDPTFQDGTAYPDWALGFGWTILTIILIPIPFCYMATLWNVQPPYSTDMTILDVFAFIHKPTKIWVPNDGSQPQQLVIG